VANTFGKCADAMQQHHTDAIVTRSVDGRVSPEQLKRRADAGEDITIVDPTRLEMAVVPTRSRGSHRTAADEIGERHAKVLRLAKWCRASSACSSSPGDV
jgi:hypothetical protein